MDKIIGVLVLVFVSTSANSIDPPCEVTCDGTQPDDCIISVKCKEFITTDISANIRETTCFKEKTDLCKITFEADRIKKDRPQDIDVAIDDILQDKVKSITIVESETTEVLNTILNKLTAAENITISRNNISEFDLKILTRDTLKYINASNNKISKLVCPPDSIDKKVKSINLSYNNIKDIPNSCFKYFEKLRALDLSHNKITKIDVLAFQGLGNLKNLSLANNNLQQIDDTFLMLGNILELSLAYNNINEIIPKGLMAMTKLLKLDLKGNQLSKLGENIFKSLKEITSLDLSENKLTTIPVLDNNTLLEELYLQNNFIYNIPKGHFRNNKIKKINLKNNKISGALDQDAFEGLLISEIDLSSNKISQLGPKCFFNVKSTLKKVNLYNNRLKQVLETAFQDLVLSELDLSNNELNEIQFRKNSSSDLKFLNVSHNKLSSLDFDFQNLELLDTSYNNIELFEFSNFHFRQLKTMNFSNNPLNILLEENNLLDLGQVIEMDISNTNIKGFKPNAFKHMENLKKLKSHHCEINEIQNAFHGVNSLEELDLSYNKLTDEVTLNINTLKMLNLSHNEIVKTIVSNCNKLETLSLINNSLSLMDLSSLIDLKNIYLSDNPNLTIRSNDFDNIKLLENAILNNISSISFQNATNVNIKHLELSNCKIKNIDSIYLKNIISLETLVLSHNNIISIPSKIFKDVSLTELDLSYNDIINVEPNAFASSNGIKRINLTHNQLQYLHLKSLSGLTDLDSLDVSNNKLDSFEISRVNYLSLKKIYIDNNQLTSMQFSDFSDTGLELMSIGGNDIPCTDIKYALNVTNNLKYEITTKEFSSDYNETKGIKCSSYDSKDNITATEMLQYLKKIYNCVSGKVSSKNNEDLLIIIRNRIEVLNKNVNETIPFGSDLKNILDKLNSSKNLQQDIDDHTSMMKLLTLLNETNINIKKWDGIYIPKNELQGLKDARPDELKNIVLAFNETIAKLNSSFNETISQGSDLKKIVNELHKSKIMHQDIADKLMKMDPLLYETFLKLNSSLNSGSVEYLLNFRLLAFTVLFLYYVK